MGQRITFRERASNGAVSDGGTHPAVSIVEQRVKFVPGEVTTGTPSTGKFACGPGTAYPMRVTLDQLAEIYYRVKDSKFTGSITESLGGVSVTFGFSGDPNTQLVSQVSIYDYDWFSRRGYSATDVAGYEGHFQTGYSVGGTDYYDIGGNESLWVPPVRTPSFRTGFSHEFTIFSNGGLETNPLPSHYLAYNTVDTSISPANAQLVFSGKIAWVDNNQSGNPFDPANDLYVGLEFDIFGTLYFLTSASSNSATAGNTVSTGVNLEIQLSADVLYVPLYFSTGDVSASYSGAIRLSASKWFPYKTTSGADAWDTATGGGANGGPGA